MQMCLGYTDPHSKYTLLSKILLHGMGVWHMPSYWFLHPMLPRFLQHPEQISN